MNRKDLKDYRYNQIWIEGRLEYIESYKASITKVTTVLSDMPRGSKEVQDSMAEKIAKLIDNMDILLKRINEENEKQKQILRQLEKVEQPYKLILEKVYIQGKTLVTVASEMNYSYEDICRKHGKALRKFDELENRQ